MNLSYLIPADIMTLALLHTEVEQQQEVFDIVTQSIFLMYPLTLEWEYRSKNYVTVWEWV